MSFCTPGISCSDHNVFRRAQRFMMQLLDRNVFLPSAVHSIILVIANNPNSEVLLVRENHFLNVFLWNIYHIAFCISFSSSALLSRLVISISAFFLILQTETCWIPHEQKQFVSVSYRFMDYPPGSRYLLPHVEYSRPLSPIL